MCDPVGVLEIAERLGVARNTVKQWHHRGNLPKPAYTVSGAPAWEWKHVVKHMAAREVGKPVRPVRRVARVVAPLPVRHPDWEKP